MAIQKLAPNVPLRATIKYLDIVPSKYGPQARIKTDADDLIYLPGKAPDAIQALLRAGVISSPPTELPQAEGDNKVACVVNAGARDVTVTNTVEAGQKYGRLTIVAGGNGTPPKQFKDTLDDGAPPPWEQEPPMSTRVASEPDPYAPVPKAADAYSNMRYAAIAEWALKNVRPAFEAAEIPVDASAMAAIIATLYIADSKR